MSNNYHWNVEHLLVAKSLVAQTQILTEYPPFKKNRQNNYKTAMERIVQTTIQKS